MVRAIFPARWACIAPSFSFSSTSCEDRHKVRPQPGLPTTSSPRLWSSLGVSFPLPSFMPAPILGEPGSWHREDVSSAHHPPHHTPRPTSPAAPETAPPPSGGDTALCPSHPGDGLPGSAWGGGRCYVGDHGRPGFLDPCSEWGGLRPSGKSLLRASALTPLPRLPFTPIFPSTHATWHLLCARPELAT